MSLFHSVLNSISVAPEVLIRVSGSVMVGFVAKHAPFETAFEQSNEIRESDPVTSATMIFKAITYLREDKLMTWWMKGILDVAMKTNRLMEFVTELSRFPKVCSAAAEQLEKGDIGTNKEASNSCAILISNDEHFDRNPIESANRALAHLNRGGSEKIATSVGRKIAERAIGTDFRRSGRDEQQQRLLTSVFEPPHMHRAASSLIAGKARQVSGTDQSHRDPQNHSREQRSS